MKSKFIKCFTLIFVLISFLSPGLELSARQLIGIVNNDEVIKPNIVVAKDGSGDYKTIGEALGRIPKENSSLFIVMIKNGTYNEKILIDKNHVMLLGESRAGTKIIYAEQKRIWECKNDPNDPLPAVVNVNGSNCSILNLTIKNNWGEIHKDDPIPEPDCEIDNYKEKFKPNGHQYAFKLSGNATKLIILNCNIIADGADTFCPWNHKNGMYYIKNTYFEGWTDFVCPRGDCFITDSEFFCRGGVAALWHDGSAAKEKKFVIMNSRFDGVKDFRLGRYTHDAQFIIVNSTISANAADKNIYQAKPDVEWGHRVYYSGCKSEGKSFEWLRDNFSQSGYLPEPGKINAAWTFGGNWDPEKFISENNIMKIGGSDVHE
jgi:pectinesterase